MPLRRQKKKRNVAKGHQIFPMLHWWHWVGYNLFGLLPPSTQSCISQWGISFGAAVLLPIWVEENWSNSALFFNFISLGDIRSYLYILELQNCHRITIPKLCLDCQWYIFLWKGDSENHFPSYFISSSLLCGANQTQLLATSITYLLHSVLQGNSRKRAVKLTFSFLILSSIVCMSVLRSRRWSFSSSSSVSPSQAQMLLRSELNCCHCWRFCFILSSLLRAWAWINSHLSITPGITNTKFNKSQKNLLATHIQLHELNTVQDKKMLHRNCKPQTLTTLKTKLDWRKWCWSERMKNLDDSSQQAILLLSNVRLLWADLSWYMQVSKNRLCWQKKTS